MKYRWWHSGEAMTYGMISEEIKRRSIFQFDLFIIFNLNRKCG